MKYLRSLGMFLLVFLFLQNGVCVPLLAQTLKRWGPLTSGPFFTGTAEADPPHSGYYEPWVFDTLTSSLGQSQFSMPQRISYGIWNNLEVDSYVPLNYNRVGPPSTPSGQTVTAFGVGNYHIELKRQLTADADTYHFWARPAMAITYQQWVPAGNSRDLDPALYDAEQMGNGTYNEGMNFLARKRFRPFEGYFQFGDILENPTHAGSGYTYNNGYTTVPNGEVLRVVNGNLLYYAGAFEHVLNSRHGLGYLIEYNGEAQNKHNLVFGHANAPSWNFLHVSPEAEYTWPNHKEFAMTWGGGIALPAEQSGYARSKVPMFTVTFYRNGPHGYRGE
jgi:hypothetical protein